MTPDTTLAGAIFSACRTWRYFLWRRWDGRPPLNVIGLNPSTADESADDPTIRRCMGYARAWGYGGLVMTNLYAFRSTDCLALLTPGLDVVGPENDRAISTAAGGAGRVLLAWGASLSSLPGHTTRIEVVLDRLDAQGIEPWCLKRNAGGSPAHPLYQRADLQPERYLR